MSVTETSIEVLDKVRGSLNRDQRIVLAMIEELGPCHNNRILEALQQADRAKKRVDRRSVGWVSNNAWPRVYDLLLVGVVIDMGKYKGVWDGRNVSFNFRRIAGDARAVPPGWVKAKVKRKISPNRVKAWLSAQGNAGNVDKMAMDASAAGRKLREYRRVKGRKLTRKTKQLVFEF